MKEFKLTSVIYLLAFSAYAQNDQKEINKKEIEKLSTDWMRATMNRDEKTLNKIVAAEFKLGGTDLDKPGLPRDVWMKNTMENLKIDSINYIKMRVDIIDNVAVVQSIFYWSAAFRDSPAVPATVNLIDTWINRGGQGWQVVSRLVVD